MYTPAKIAPPDGYSRPRRENYLPSQTREECHTGRDGLIFLTGSCAYPTLEMIWRGRTHASMALAGGLCLLLINKICCEKMRRCPLVLRCVAASCLITGVEFTVGFVCNRWIGLNVWDYSRVPLNLLGQICLPYSLLWCLLAVPAMALCELYRRGDLHRT